MPRILSVVALLLLHGAVHAGDWPGWLGPHRNGSSDEKIAPWKNDLKPLWKDLVDEGHSSPVVAKGRVYLHTAVKNKLEEQLSCYDAVSGKPLWSKAYPRGNFSSLFGGGPRATPSVVDGKVYTFGITGLLTCFDADKGDILWQVDTLKEFGADNLFFGASCSPLVYKDRVMVDVGGQTSFVVSLDSFPEDKKAAVLDAVKSIVTVKGKGKKGPAVKAEDLVEKTPSVIKTASTQAEADKYKAQLEAAGAKASVAQKGKKAGIVALDRNTGKVVWNNVDAKATYSSGIVVNRGGVEQVIFLTAKGLVSLSPVDGKIYWESPLVDKLNESSTTPVVVGDMLFASSVTYGGTALKFTDGPEPNVKKEWVKPDLACYFSTPVAVGTEYLYIVTSKGQGLAFTSTLRCVEMSTGKELWNRPRVGAFHASLLKTGDDKLLLLEEGGELVMVDPNPKEYKELARSKVCGNTWAHPALANGLFYIRDGSALICVSLK